MSLSYRERDEVYRCQVRLRAVKPCEMCGEWLLVEAFDSYGTQPCDECYCEKERARRSDWMLSSQSPTARVKRWRRQRIAA
jgi:hypothetical protein